MIEWMVSSFVLTAAVIALRYLLRGRVRPGVQYALWLLVLVRLLVPVSFGSSGMSVMTAVERAPVVQAAESVRDVDTIWQAHDGTVEGFSVGQLMPDVPVTVASGVTDNQFGRMESALTLRKVLLPVWWCGAGVTMLVFLAANSRFARRLRRSRVPLETAEQTRLPVYVTTEPAAPCLFGLFRPAIYVTAETAADPQLLCHTTAHEMTHFRHGDHVWALLRTVCLALHWWDPLVWWAAALSRQDAELACDETTVRYLGETERAAYGRTLIRMTCRRGAGVLLTATAMDGGKNSLRERIVLLAKKPRTAAAAAIALVLAAALCIGCTFTGAKKNGAETPVQSDDTIAGYMASLTVAQVRDWDVGDYPDITLGRLVTAMNKAADSQITPEEALGYGQGGQEWSVAVQIDGGPRLILSCGTVGEIVHVTNLSMALSSDEGAVYDAYFRDETLYQLIRHAQDSVAQAADGSSVWDVLQQIGWPDRAELTTETFTYNDLKVQVTNVYQTGKGTVREGGLTFENDVFLVCPGAVFTVLEGGSENNSDGEPQANWRYYTPDADMRELWPGGEPIAIETNSAIGRESFPVLSLYLFEGWLQAPTTDPAASVRAAIEAEAQKNYAGSVRVESAAVNEAETRRVAQYYKGSELAVFRGWSDDLLDNHFAVVDAAYYIEYDHTRTPMNGGHVDRQFYLIQGEDGRWVIVDNTTEQQIRENGDVIDQAAYQRFKPQLDAEMQRALDQFAASPGGFYAYELLQFESAGEYGTEDGDRAELYRFDFALLLERPEEDFWVGGIYMDDQKRVRGCAVTGNVVARYRNGTLLGLVFMGSDNSYVPAFEEDWDWAEQMLAALGVN